MTDGKQLARDYFRAFRDRDEAWWDAHIALDFVRHDPGLDFEVRGPDGIRRLAELMHGGMSEIDMDIRDMVEEGDRVLARLRQLGRHTGEFQGIPASGNRIDVEVMDLFRFDGDMLVEHWALMDNATMQKQMGAD